MQTRKQRTLWDVLDQRYGNINERLKRDFERRLPWRLHLVGAGISQQVMELVKNQQQQQRERFKRRVVRVRPFDVDVFVEIHAS
jgi:hypothetical protein